MDGLPGAGLNAMSRLPPALVDTLRRASRRGLPLVDLLLLLALAALLAHWTWRFAAPPPPPVPVAGRGHADSGNEFDALRAAGLFGGKVPVEAAGERPTALNLKLHGVFAAPRGRRAMALLSAGNGEQAVARGDEIQPGVVLEEVAADHVILLNRGLRERLDLETVGVPLAAAAPGEKQVTGQDIRQALANPQSVGVQVGEQAGPLAGLQIVRVEEGGLAARLGLQSGDTLRMVNGMPIANAQDLARLLSDAGNVERITLVGERQGAPLTLSYRLQP
jgi:general secretion pathway protein C